MSRPMHAPEPHDDAAATIGGAPRSTPSRARDVERVLADAALPAELTALVRSVVGATRLTRSERADVAAELVGHFRDGLDAGAVPSELLRLFGDGRVAAKLIRRAKIRNRSPIWHAARFLTRAVGVTICSMVVIYVAIVIRLFSGSPTISRDYLVEINAPVDRIPVEQRAWPKWREALRALPTPTVDPDGELSRPFSDVVASSEYVAQASTALALARQAAKLPHLGVKLSIGQGEFTLEDTPHTGSSGGAVLDQSLIGGLLAPLGKMGQRGHAPATERMAAAQAGNGS